jgi:hypothetical protein
MPAISMFYGILVYMFYEADQPHHLPHIHVRFSGHKAAIAIEDGQVLAGEIPTRQLKMVQVWVDLHHDELLADWELAQSGDEPYKIAPLQ